jgi:redox-sensitive bicupin YhaK (pirin superfamily)
VHHWSIVSGSPTDRVGDGPTPAEEYVIDVTTSRPGRVGAIPVRRALPRRGRRLVGAWCFVDHIGPASISPPGGLDIAPHPHAGLQTLTWLLEGEALHRDSLGTQQAIRPGELNLMTAGHGVAHSEEGTRSYRGDVHGVQLWIAQPTITRDGPPAFEHHGALPRSNSTARSRPCWSAASTTRSRHRPRGN